MCGGTVRDTGDIHRFYILPVLAAHILEDLQDDQERHAHLCEGTGVLSTHAPFDAVVQNLTTRLKY